MPAALLPRLSAGRCSVCVAPAAHISSYQSKRHAFHSSLLPRASRSRTRRRGAIFVLADTAMPQLVRLFHYFQPASPPATSGGHPPFRAPDCAVLHVSGAFELPYRLCSLTHGTLQPALHSDSLPTVAPSRSQWRPSAASTCAGPSSCWRQMV